MIEDDECPCGHLWLELPVRPRDLERDLLSAAGGAGIPGGGRAGLLRRALRHGGGELDVLPAAGGGHHGPMGRADTGGLRVLRQAPPEVLACHGGRPGCTTAATRGGAKRIGAAPADTGRRGRVPGGSGPDGRKRQAGRGSGSVSGRLPSRWGDAGLPERAARRLQGLPDGGGTAPPVLERRGCGHARPPRRVPGRVGADRRTQVPSVDSAGSCAEHRALLLHAPARPERRPVVVSGGPGGPLQLPLFDGGVAAVCRSRVRGRPGGAEGVPLLEQPLRGEVGGERPVSYTHLTLPTNRE